jgi:hypothetical protein
MTAAQQHRNLGVSAQASDGLVIVQVGTSMTALRPSEARTFCKCLAREMWRADITALDHELEEARR